MVSAKIYHFGSVDRHALLLALALCIDLRQLFLQPLYLQLKRHFSHDVIPHLVLHEALVIQPILLRQLHLLLLDVDVSVLFCLHLPGLFVQSFYLLIGDVLL